MKTIIKILLTIAMLNAAARVGLAAASYFQLKDASQEILTFGARISTDDLRNDIYRKAQILQVPLGVEDVRVTREGKRTSASATYTQGVEIAPTFTYPITFTFSVDALEMTGLGPAPPAR